MKKTAFAMVFGATALLGSMSAMAQEVLDFVLVNKTGYTVNEVYVSPVSTSNWEEDVMGSDVLNNGERVEIEFAETGRGCNWDLKVVYDDGEEAEWAGFDLCTVSTVVLRYNRKSGETWAEYE